MRFVAELDGDPHVIENVSICMQGAEARFRKIGNQWVLESTAFNRCSNRVEAFRIADDFISNINSILAIYLGLQQACSVRSIMWLNDRGIPFRRSLREHVTLYTYLAPRKSELTTVVGDETLGSAITHLACTNAALRECLYLIRGQTLHWSQIYDVIEYLGGAAQIGAAGFATKANTARVRQTANHYRHLGSKKNYPLPKNSPSLEQARKFTCEILKKWIAYIV
jgi:hypothetical protein